MVECDGCGREVQRPTILQGQRLCGTCVLNQDEDQQLPHPKNLTNDWRAFTRGKRKHHSLWR